MTFSDLSSYFEDLEKTSSRLSLIDILAHLFSDVKTGEIAQVCYFLQGRVAPFYKPVEMGMSEKLVAEAIGRAFGSSKKQVLIMYGHQGDLGKVAAELSSRFKVQSKKLTVEEVFRTFREIAETTGEGTVEKKLDLLVGLLKKADTISTKYLVRIPLGNLRLGIGDPTILDALAEGRLGDRKQRPILEEAYNKTSDLGVIGETLWKHGLSGIKALDVVVGRPLRPQLCERLPDPKTILEKFGGEAHVQYKYDGFRIQIHLDRSQPEGLRVRLFSRNLEETTPMFPEVVEGTLKQVKAQEAILDSEALASNPESEEFLPFQETTKRRRKYGIKEMQKRLPLKAFVFDVMYVNGKSLIDLPLKERIKVMATVVHGEKVLIPQPGEMVDKTERLEELFSEALTKGLEGLVVKRPDSKYEAGARNFNWVKLKRHSSSPPDGPSTGRYGAGGLKDTIDCVILGYIFGRGKRAQFGAGALLAGVYDDQKDEFVTVSKIGTGLTDEEWREIHKRAGKIKLDHQPARVNSILVPSVWVKPEIVIEVLADEITRSPVHTAGKIGSNPGYALRFPRLVKFREDKKAEDATTVKELVEMYKQQFRKRLARRQEV